MDRNGPTAAAAATDCRNRLRERGVWDIGDLPDASMTK
jgi:hypothetical protein